MYLYTRKAWEIRMNKFIVDGRYAELLNSYGIRVEEALRKAELPGDAFCHKAPVMEEEAYYRFMDAAGSLITDPQIPVQIACRTLQRKLSEEQTTFQKQLNNTREMLALHYIRNTDISTNDIAYLPGYQELNSFLRAFAVWTGMSVSEYKKRI